MEGGQKSALHGILSRTTKEVTMAATTDERIIDESYKAVFVLGKEQIAAHVCYDEEEDDKTKLSIGRQAMRNMRIRVEDDRIITESTNGKMLLQVKERIGQHNLEHFPFDVNPSESPKTVMQGPQYIPGDVLNELTKGFPRRKNFNKANWQRAAVFSFTEDELEIGHSDKQGRATVDTWDLPKAVNAFPPIENVWPKGDAVSTARFDLAVLKRALEAMEAAGAVCIDLSIWDKKQAAKLSSITQYGKVTDREINALVMPMSEQT